MNKKEKKEIIKKTFKRMIFVLAAAIIIIFWLAGRLDYWQGWLYIGLYTLIGAVAFFFIPLDVIKERMNPKGSIKFEEKLFFAGYVPATVSIIIIGALDAGRFGWSPKFPAILYILFAFISVFAYVILIWSILTNLYFSSVVRIQKDRGQKVVETGPYAYIRHPGYTAGIINAVGMSLLLGSLYALIPAGIIILLFIFRIHFEEKLLKKELEGYKEYTKKVKYKLLPKIW